MTDLKLFTGSELQQMLLDRTERVTAVVKAFGTDSEVTKAAYAQDSTAEITCAMALKLYLDSDPEATVEDTVSLFDMLALEMNLLLVIGFDARSTKASAFSVRDAKLEETITTLLETALEIQEALKTKDGSIAAVPEPAVEKAEANVDPWSEDEDFWGLSLAAQGY